VSELPRGSRRDFLKGSAAIAGGALAAHWSASSAAPADAAGEKAGALAADARPWHQRTLRWGQTNLTEIDPGRIDIGFWRSQWRSTRVQGVVVNAGGIAAFYPTQVPFHHRASGLGDRDLFGELTRAAREEGLAVFARMDSNRAHEDFYRAHPDWFARDAAGKPYIVTGLYVACVNGPYYREYLPSVLREIVGGYRPDGVTDNNWNGPQRHQPCFCDHCSASFRARTGGALPAKADWDDPEYREWILWNYARRLEIWDEFNRVTRAAGGPDCLWVGMMSGSLEYQSRVFRDDREVFRRTELTMLDHQRRFDAEGFAHNAETGLRLHAVGGWNKLIPESMAMYHLGEHNFRLATKPPAEARLWAVSGFAGGIQPWWHHLGAVQEDRRMFDTAEPLWRWHEQHQRHLVDRLPVANVGLQWSQRNMDFFGRDDAGALVDDPWNGCAQALVRARIPAVPVHVDDVERVTRELGLKLLVLPNLAALSDAQVDAIRRFVAAGGALLATGMSSLCDEAGRVRADLALGDLFGARVPPTHAWRAPARRAAQARDWAQTYLRLPGEPARRHETLRGFAGTSLLAFGGTLEPVTIARADDVALTFVRAPPLSPPEDVWMREPDTRIAALVCREIGDARVAWLPADIDRRFARDQLPDHGDLLAQLVRWCLRGDVPFEVDAPGLIDCRLHRTRGGECVLHLVNLNNPNAWRTPVQETVPTGPVRVRVKAHGPVRALVSGEGLVQRRAGHWREVTIPRIAEHEVLVFAGGPGA
jgi:hypothetical protein